MPHSNALVEAILRRQPLHVIQRIVEADPESVHRKVNPDDDDDDDDDEDNWYPLHEAVVAGSPVDVVRFLIDKHPWALRMRDKRGWLPLHLAVQPRLRRRLRQRNMPDESREGIRCLRSRWPGAKHQLTNGGWDARQIAAHFENWAAVQVLDEPTRIDWAAFGHDRLDTLHPLLEAIRAMTLLEFTRSPVEEFRMPHIDLLRIRLGSDEGSEGWRGPGSRGDTGMAPALTSEESNSLIHQQHRRHGQQQDSLHHRQQQRRLLRTARTKPTALRRNVPRTSTPRGHTHNSRKKENSRASARTGTGDRKQSRRPRLRYGRSKFHETQWWRGAPASAEGGSGVRCR